MDQVGRPTSPPAGLQRERAGRGAPHPDTRCPTGPGAAPSRSRPASQEPEDASHHPIARAAAHDPSCTLRNAGCGLKEEHPVNCQWIQGEPTHISPTPRSFPASTRTSRTAGRADRWRRPVMVSGSTATDWTTPPRRGHGPPRSPAPLACWSMGAWTPAPRMLAGVRRRVSGRRRGPRRRGSAQRRRRRAGGTVPAGRRSQGGPRRHPAGRRPMTPGCARA